MPKMNVKNYLPRISDALLAKKLKYSSTTFMVLTGGEYAYQRKDGVLVVPIGCLKD